MRNLNLKLLALLAFITTVAVAGNAVKKFNENTLRFGTDADVRSLVFDYTADGSSAILSVDPADEYFDFNNRVDLQDELHVVGLTQINNRFVVDSTTALSRPCAIQTIAQRDLISAAEADCVYNTDDNQWEIYDGTDWTPVGSGSGGGLSVFYSQDFEKSSYAVSDEGNGAYLNVSPLIGSTIIEVGVPIAGARSLKYTQGGSNNDWVEIDTISLDLKQRNAYVMCTAWADMTNMTNDVLFKFYNETDSESLLTVSDKLVAGSAKAKYQFIAFIPQSATTISLGFHANQGFLALDSFLIDDISCSTQLWREDSIIDSQQYIIEQAGSSLTDRTNEIEFNLGTATITDTGEGYITAEDDSGNTRTKFVANRPLDVTVSINLRMTTGKTPIVAKNGTPVLQGAEVSTGDDHTTVSVRLKLDATDYITVGPGSNVGAFDGTSVSNLANVQRVVIHAEAQVDSVIAPVSGSSTETKLLSADVTTSGDIAGLQFDNLEVGEWYMISGTVRLRSTSSGNPRVDFYSGASATGSLYGSVSQTGSTAANFENNYGVNILFQADSDTLYSNANAAAASIIRGNNDKFETNLSLTNITTQFLAAIPNNTVKTPSSLSNGMKSCAFRISSTATVLDDAGCVSSASNPSTGVFTINFNSFSDSVPLHCSCSAEFTVRECDVNATPTQSSIGIDYFVSSSGTKEDRDFSVICFWLN
jgi:hypothetical protein